MRKIPVALLCLSVFAGGLFVHARDSRADPFVTAGYTLLFRSGHANPFNFGAV